MSEGLNLTREEAAREIAALAESIKPILGNIVRLADAYDLDVSLLHEFDNYLHYSGRPYIDEYCEIRGDGGWASSHC